MRHFFMKVKICVVCAIATSCIAIAPASAGPPIIGVWSMTVRDHYGEAFAVVWDEFDPNGRLMVRFITKAGTETYYGKYHMASASRVWAIFTDYEPKQLCTLVCSPVTPVMPIGRAQVSPVRFIGAYVMYLGADRYNRQR
jgi:hypothetical protein